MASHIATKNKSIGTSARAHTKGRVRLSSLIKNIKKRDGSVVKFDLTRISRAVYKAMLAVDEGGEDEANYIAQKVLFELLKDTVKGEGNIPTVEEVQDVVETELILEKFVRTAKAYIIYRKERAAIRAEEGEVPEHVKELVRESKKHFTSSLGEFVYYRTYSRWLDDEGRRETWIETVDRYVSFMRENLKDRLTKAEYKEVREGILSHKAMPSMRLLQFAGEAARRCNVCAYNCSFVAPTTLKDFGEIMYISMSGTGCGFSVESKFIQQLPQIKEQTGVMRKQYVISDSKKGWAEAFVYGLETWYSGEDVTFDYSKLRPAGARLKTSGGKSSGPEPLMRLIDFTRVKVLARQGRRLTNLDAHDIICYIGDIVVAGGVRRSALISISDLDDDAVRDSKQGQFYLTDPHRSLANNSASYEEKPTSEQFLEEWLSLTKSGTGERGIFNRAAAKNTLPKRRVEKLGDRLNTIGTNPCGEILLQPKQFCNLSEVVARADDTEKTLLKKIRLATILGTYQATLTKFDYLDKKWSENCEEERLLGVSITGQWDSHIVRNPAVLRNLRAEAIRVNKIYAKRFGICPSACVTTTKPSGNLSQTVDSASGMHPRHAQYYIRRVRISKSDALFRMLRDQGVPYHPEVGQTMENATTMVLEFPVRSPKGSKIFKDSLTAIEQLEYWKNVKLNYTEHNPSVTISVGEDEWILVADWVFENWDIIGGISFLPRYDHVYQLAPYEAIDKKRYNELSKRLKNIDYSKIVTYEKHDETEQKRELACMSGTCEI